jgi:ATP-binding cassette subfamily B protein/subfamily B ATP-binding cassette protein MsbA
VRANGSSSGVKLAATLSVATAVVGFGLLMLALVARTGRRTSSSPSPQAKQRRPLRLVRAGAVPLRRRAARSGAAAPDESRRGHPYRTLLRYAAPYRRGWALIFVVTLLSTGFALLTPWPMKILVDNVLGHKHVSAFVSVLPGADSTQGLLLWVVGASLLFFAADSTFDVVLSVLWVRVGQSMVYDLARDLFRRIQRRSLLFHTRSPVGDSMGRVTGDCWAVHTVVDELLFSPGHALITTVGIAVVMVQLNPFLTAVSLVVAPLMVGSSILLGKPIRIAGKQLRQAEIDVQSHVQQTLAGMTVVQAFAQEHQHRARFHQLAAAALRSKMRETFVGNVNGLASGLSTTLGLTLITFLGARAVMHGSLTVGGLLVFVSYVGTLQQQIGAFTGIYSKLQAARASVDRVTEILDAEPEVADRPGALALPRLSGHVRLEEVGFAYEPGRPVLRGISLEAHPGEVVAIVGATGAGKTTLVSLIPRFFDPAQGRVLVDGHDVRDVQLKSLREQVALVLQESFLFPISIAENIAYGRPQASRAEIEQAARAANAHAFVERLPEGYETHVGERGATLSGGERQRIAIARALLKDAPILILDEPTSALDAETEQLLLEALDRLMVGRTTFIIAHRLSTIRNADRIVVVEDGAVVEAGSPSMLLERKGAYARLHAIQLGAARA